MIGQVVGNYKIVEKIGEGGMGAVFKGVDIMLEREVAVKMLRPELARDSGVVERFRSEAVTLAKLNHPNIATLYSFFRERDEFFMVLEYVRGDTIDGVLQRSGPMPADTAVPLFCQALDGIGHAHRAGIIHRDIKPANLMITHGDALVKVMDFGIARALGAARMTREGRIVGTIEYMAPEQIKGHETDTRTDVYALGMVLYEMVTGRLPFASDSEYELMRAQVERQPLPPRDLNADVPPAIESAIMRALAKVPDARFPTANEFRAMLLEFLGLPAVVSTGPLSATGAPKPRPGAPSRPSGEPALPPGDVSGPPSSGAIRETRFASAAPAASLPASPVPALATHPASQPLWKSFGWKHYTFAGSGLFAAFAIPLAMLAFGGSPSPPDPQRPTQTAEPRPAEARPAEPSPPRSASVPTEAPATPQVRTSSDDVPVSEAPAAKTARPKRTSDSKRRAAEARKALDQGQ
jgi:serine/threonine protein kinase